MPIIIALLSFVAVASFKNQTTIPSHYSTTLIDTVRKPILFLEETTVQPMRVVFISDTTTVSRLSKVFERDYQEIFAFLFQNNLPPGKTLAAYHQYSDPLILDIAVEVDRLPATCTGRIMARTIEGGHAVVAHYQGPYEGMSVAYNAIATWIKSNNKQAKNSPVEIYLNDPMTVSDKYLLKTDIIQQIY